MRCRPDCDARVPRDVFGRIPAVEGQVEAADETDGIVDDDKLLVVRCADRMSVVHLELEPMLRLRGEPELRQPFAFQREQQGKIPAEDVGVELWPRREQRGQKIAERIG
jgi:hypothetical protein